MKYYLVKEVETSYEDTLFSVTEALKTQGFGVLTEIDVKSTLKKKLDVDFRKYKILGACNPPLAHKALTADEQIGNLLPCNVVVQEKEDGKVLVSAINPQVMMGVSDLPELKELADEVGEKLNKVLEII